MTAEAFKALLDRLNIVFPEALKAIRNSALPAPERIQARISLSETYWSAWSSHQVEDIVTECERVIALYAKLENPSESSEISVR